MVVMLTMRPPFPGFQHQLDRLAHAEEGGTDVHRIDLLPDGCGSLGEWLVGIHPGAIDQDVAAAVLLPDLVEEGDDLGFLLDVGGDGLGLPTGGLDLVDDGIG
jgi:hypothetical protein